MRHWSDDSAGHSFLHATGKSLSYALIRRILDGYPVAFQAGEDAFFVVYGKNSVEHIERSMADEILVPLGAWALVDSTIKGTVPMGTFPSSHNSWFPIQAPPNPGV